MTKQEGNSEKHRYKRSSEVVLKVQGTLLAQSGCDTRTRVVLRLCALEKLSQCFKYPRYSTIITAGAPQVRRGYSQKPDRCATCDRNRARFDAHKITSPRGRIFSDEGGMRYFTRTPCSQEGIIDQWLRKTLPSLILVGRSDFKLCVCPSQI